MSKRSNCLGSVCKCPLILIPSFPELVVKQGRSAFALLWKVVHNMFDSFSRSNSLERCGHRSYKTVATCRRHKYEYDVTSSSESLTRPNGCAQGQHDSSLLQLARSSHCLSSNVLRSSHSFPSGAPVPIIMWHIQ